MHYNEAKTTMRITKTDKKWMQAAKRLAKNSLHKQFLFGAILVKNGRVLARATNGKNPGKHAELRLIAKSAAPAGATLYVVRVNKSSVNKARCSKPCLTCRSKIEESGLYRVVYYDETGNIIDMIPKTNRA